MTPTRPAQALALLNEALAIAAAQTDPYNRIAIPAGVGAAMRPLDPKRAETILRQTAALAGAMGHDDEAAQSRIAAAAALAPIDPDAAMALVKDLSVQERPHALARLAVALADAVPARSEALLDQITELSSPWTDTRREVCRRMARVEPERALKIARASDFDELRAVYLAEIAQVLAESKPEAAAKAMDEAYATLDPTPSSAGGGTGYQDSDLALLRLAYFGVRLGYSRTDEMVMRAMSMRPDPYEGSKAAMSGLFSNDTARRTGQVAELLALFDHDAARALLEGRYLEGGKLPSTESTGYPGGQAGVRALAMLDPEWALKLAKEAPETEQKFSGLPPKEEALGSLVYYFATPVEDRPRQTIARDPMVWMNVLMPEEDNDG